ncbi:MAG: NAD-dependent epimerase/dehydratase family protein [Microthrixaceae bacterium]
MELQDSRILLVGGAGLIGSHILDLLVAEDVREIVVFDNFVRGTRANIEHHLDDPRVRVIDGDMLDRAAVASAMEGIDGVFLLAALWLLQCAEDPRSGLQVNVEGNFNVVDACRAAGVRRLVFSSSASVYGDALVEPMPEDHPLNNRTFYGATKVALEQMLRSYNEMYGLPYVALRYFNIYGPRQDYRNAYVSVIMRVLDRLDQGEPPLIFGDGSQAYDFIYVKDIARANIVAMKSDISDEVFNVATGVKTSIREVVQMLQEIVGTDLAPEHQPTSQVFVTDRVGSPVAARDLLGFVPSTPLRAGLEELVAWRAEHIRQQS